MMATSFSKVSTAWHHAWQSKQFRTQAVVTALLLVFLAFSINKFFAFIQTRQGAPLNDPILNEIPPYDMSVYIFVLIYLGLIIGLMYLIPYPMILLRVLQAYVMVVFIRVCTIFMFPLEPSESIIPLRDPLIDQFFYANNVITKDLFFSGHVATLFLLVLALPNPLMKYLYVVITLAVAILILIQHVHYSIDIIAAPVFAWICYRLTKLFEVNRQVGG
ncbi:phosphatase PAP2-related protein [Chryseolinea sp. H1M3-3]|uniref:phosphatase PAP2-related protein n=1 Tax=Chryseolinea sp. H1M3-3 TaxID=3034144 RepID=UPI0023EDB8EC|nr:phosphatase PAP2-related protein [Chryseolinea sp. H1M3-3]